MIYRLKALDMYMNGESEMINFLNELIVKMKQEVEGVEWGYDVDERCFLSTLPPSIFNSGGDLEVYKKIFFYYKTENVKKILFEIEFLKEHSDSFLFSIGSDFFEGDKWYRKSFYCLNFLSEQIILLLLSEAVKSVIKNDILKCYK